MNRSIKNLALLVAVIALGCWRAQAQTCYTPITSWQGSYTLSASANNVQSPIGWTVVTMNETTSSNNLNLIFAGTDCNKAGWAGSLNDPSDSGSYTSNGTFSCAPGTETANFSASGSPLPQSEAGVAMDFSKNTYYFWPAMVLNGTETDTDCNGNTHSVSFPFPLYPPELLEGQVGVVALPSAPGPLNGNVTFQGTDFSFGEMVPWTITFALTPSYDDCDDCKQEGGPGIPVSSSIGSQNQSLGEDVPIVGTGFNLHYESDRAPGAAANAIASADAAMIGGWTLNVHHAYDPNTHTLFLGDGTQRNGDEVGTPVSFNGNTLLTSEDGSEVYVFSGSTGQHLQTVRPLTGALEYQFGYDAAGNLITVTDASGNVTTIERDASEHATFIVSPYGQKTTLSVDSIGSLSGVTDPLGKSQTFINTSTGLLTSRTDANRNVFNYTYDSQGRLTKDADPLGGYTALTRTNATSGFGWNVGETTAMGRTSSYQTTLNLPWVHSSTSTSSEQHTNTWPNGLQATSTKTQKNGQLFEGVTLPDGSSYSDTLGPDPRWGIQVPIDTSSKTTLGNLTMNSTSTRAATLGTAGDPFSLTSQTDTDTINGRKYTSIFTASDRTYLDTTPVGRKATTVLDSLERISSAQLGTLLPIQYAYDTHGRLSTATQGTRKATFTYDANGFLASVTDPLNLTDSFTYDADGRVLTKTLADGRVIKFAYDANGNLSRLIPPGKAAHTFAYNAVSLPSSYTPPIVTGAGATTYAYDKDRNLTTITRPDAKKVTFNYDTAGRLSSITAPTETVNYAYNATTGNLASATIPSGESIAYGYNGPLPTSSTWSGTVAGSVSRTFNNNFWMASLSLDGANTINFTYDNDDLVTKAGAMTITNDPNNGLIAATTLGSVTDMRGYNTFGELTGYTAKYKTTTLYAVTYTRDADGRVASKVETINGRSTTYAYTYDKAGRLTGVTQNDTTSSTYRYDTNSNRLTATTASGTVTGTYDAQDRLLTYGTSTFTYTANGELASQKTGTQTTQYQYDVLGNLVSVTLPNATKLTYLVDPENHRVAKQVDGTQQTGYLYDGDEIVAQLNGSNQIVSQFVYATGATSPDYMVNGGATYRIICDQLGSPRLVVNTTTGAIAEQMNYDEFGNVLLDSDAGFQPFGFAGGLKDPDTGFVRFGARDYNPSIGRWTTKDPLLFEGGDSNLYAYVLNDPVNFIDSDGTTVFRVSQQDFKNATKKTVVKKRRAVCRMPEIWIIGFPEPPKNSPPKVNQPPGNPLNWIMNFRF